MICLLQQGWNSYGGGSKVLQTNACMQRRIKDIAQGGAQNPFSLIFYKCFPIYPRFHLIFSRFLSSQY